VRHRQPAAVELQLARDEPPRAEGQLVGARAAAAEQQDVELARAVLDRDHPGCRIAPGLAPSPHGHFECCHLARHGGVESRPRRAVDHPLGQVPEQVDRPRAADRARQQGLAPRPDSGQRGEGGEQRMQDLGAAHGLTGAGAARIWQPQGGCRKGSPPSPFGNRLFAMDARRRRILFRARHRGTHETDLLVGGFVAERIATMDGAELDSLEAVLDLPDPDLFDWLTGRRAVPAKAETPLLRAMVDWAQARRGVRRG
jgi:antitoxin CptB